MSPKVSPKVSEDVSPKVVEKVVQKGSVYYSGRGFDRNGWISGLFE